MVKPQPQSKAIGRMLRTSPQKLGLVASLIRGKKVERAVADLTFSRRRISHSVKKILESAIANAENNHGLNIDRLIVAEVWVGKSLVMKRFRPRAKGRAAGINKPFSEMTIILREEDVSEKANKVKKPRKQEAGKGKISGLSDDTKTSSQADKDKTSSQADKARPEDRQKDKARSLQEIAERVKDKSSGKPHKPYKELMKQEEQAIQESNKQETSKQKGKKQETREQETSKQEIKKQEAKKQEASKQEGKKQESRKQEARKQDSRKQEARKQETKKQEVGKQKSSKQKATQKASTQTSANKNTNKGER